MSKKMTTSEFKNYVISEATKLYKAELLKEEVSTFKFKVKSKRDVFVKRHLGNDLERFKCINLLEILSQFESET